MLVIVIFCKDLKRYDVTTLFGTFYLTLPYSFIFFGVFIFQTSYSIWYNILKYILFYTYLNLIFHFYFSLSLIILVCVLHAFLFSFHLFSFHILR